MICKNCGKNIDIENQKFCYECGSPLTLEDDNVSTDAEIAVLEQTQEAVTSCEVAKSVANKICFFNGIDAIVQSVNAYEKLKLHAVNQQNLLDGFKMIVDTIVSGNPALAMFRQNNDCFDTMDDKTIKIGECECDFKKNDDDVRTAVSMALNSNCIKTNGYLSFDFLLDPSTPFSMTIESGDINSSVTEFVESILFAMLKIDTKTNFRCIDGTANGANFIHVHELVNTTYELSGGKVFSSARDISDVIDSLVRRAANTVSSIGSATTFKEYNENTSRKIDKMIAIIFAEQFSYSDDSEKIRKMLKNSAKNGISFIIVGKRDFVKHFYDLSDYDITFKDNSFYIDEDEYVSLKPCNLNEKADTSENHFAKEVIRQLEDANKVDTVFSHHTDLVNQECLKMSSEKMLRIPFAIDRYDEYQYLEIGGKAPAHCLLSGGTGCGKSTTLHAFIMQIVRNYHPDEAEIWAIDCKGVEFNRYMETNTPHFKVIACGSEKEMLLNVIDKIWEEYLKRLALFNDVGAKDIEEYREKKGTLRAMPRIFVVIDEFHMMTAAAFDGYYGGINYSDRITQIMKLVRATGISMLLSSQNVTMGLKGFSQDAIDQAGARLCMKHEASNSHEIREVLNLQGIEAVDVVNSVAHFGKGQLYTNKLVKCNSLWIDNWKEEIAKINALIGNDYTPKERIFAMSSESMGNSKRPQIDQMLRHPIQKFVDNDYTYESEGEVEWYPAAPVTLDDYFRENLTDAAGENMLIVGNKKELTDSVIFFSLLGFLMSPDNKVVVNCINPTDKSRQNLLNLISKIKCDRLTINSDICGILNLVKTFERVRNVDDTNTIYLWLGLNKLENEIINLEENVQDDTADAKQNDIGLDQETAESGDMLFAFILGEANKTKSKSKEKYTEDDLISYDKATELIQKLFERGPDNKLFNLVYFKTYKEMKKVGFAKVQEFERRIGTTMSTDDASNLFGSGTAASKTDEDTVIYYGGSGSVVSLRPYHLPADEWIAKFNISLDNI